MQYSACFTPERSEYLEEESDEEKETREGPQFQAQPPLLCIRKAGHEGGPPPAEAALLNHRLLPPAVARPPPRHAFVDLSAMIFEQRWAFHQSTCVWQRRKYP